ncbi:MAG: hypothetical protein HOH43_08080 [Candidatus Latescibacteria bacterium]|jgi:hypothetical protein|nr:hypothetical protein [Candidatus Latescibacterota bacterium]
MGIDFNHERWENVRKVSRHWWAGELDRPLIQMRVSGCDPGRPQPELPARGFTSSYSLTTRAEAIVDRWDYDLSRAEYLGDAFPCIWPNFGPGVLAALMGAELINDEHTAWFVPREQQEIADIHFKDDPDNVWLKRLEDLYRAALERWQGLVQLSMTDLGGSLDILSTFRPSERLPFDLYDHPDQVKRLTWEAHEMWFKHFEAFNERLRPTNPGYTAWTPIFSETPYYMLQCDFCYMVSPDMFDEFVKPELAAACKRLTNPFYHLDGPGQLPIWTACWKLRN